ncbi:MAG: hypothetical protein LC667_17765 [Thioalkalivibrio sp.]|nr:hypothetical protein [Thioalkalivibrio sp.]
MAYFFDLRFERVVDEDRGVERRVRRGPARAAGAATRGMMPAALAMVRRLTVTEGDARWVSAIASTRSMNISTTTSGIATSSPH